MIKKALKKFVLRTWCTKKSSSYRVIHHGYSLMLCLGQVLQSKKLLTTIRYVFMSFCKFFFLNKLKLFLLHFIKQVKLDFDTSL